MSSWDTSKFSKQMWEPFARWVFKTYPDDAAVMFDATQIDFQLTPESIRLWDERTREYVKGVNQGELATARSSPSDPARGGV